MSCNEKLSFFLILVAHIFTFIVLLYISVKPEPEKGTDYLIWNLDSPAIRFLINE